MIPQTIARLGVGLHLAVDHRGHDHDLVDGLAGGLDLRFQVGAHDGLELVELGLDQVPGGGSLVERVGLRQQVALEVVGAAGHLRALDDEVVGLPVGRVGGVDVVLRLAVARRLPLGGQCGRSCSPRGS